MIIVKIQGGLGNQLFQYASGRRLSEKYNTSLKLDISDYTDQNNRQYKLNNYCIKEEIATKKDVKILKNPRNNWLDKIRPIGQKRIIDYKDYGYDARILRLGTNVYLDGYWQNEKYFSDISDIIRHEFVLKNPLSKNSEILLEKIINNNSISIHVRRGDYITSKKFSKIYRQLDNEYYQNAVKKIKDFVENPFLLVFSDDALWIKNNISLSVPYLTVSDYKLEDYEELYLMSQCQHNIISNSTFSWWGAWLNNNESKIIMGPKVWFNFSNDDQGIMPKEWTKI